MVKAQGMCRSMRRGNATPSCQDTGPASRVACSSRAGGGSPLSPRHSGEQSEPAQCPKSPSGLGTRGRGRRFPEPAVLLPSRREEAFRGFRACV